MAEHRGSMQVQTQVQVSKLHCLQNSVTFPVSIRKVETHIPQMVNGDQRRQHL